MTHHFSQTSVEAEAVQPAKVGSNSGRALAALRAPAAEFHGDLDASNAARARSVRLADSFAHGREASRQVKRDTLLKKTLKSNEKSEPVSGEAPARPTILPAKNLSMEQVLDLFVFDYFQAVLPAPDGGGTCRVGGAIEKDAIQRSVRFLEREGLHFGATTGGGIGYELGLPFFAPGETQAVAFIAAGSRTGGMPNMTIKGGGGLCAILAPAAQEAFPGLRGTRIDVKLDFIDVDGTAYRRLLKLSQRLVAARQGRMVPVQLKGIETPQDGRTFYVGKSEKARVFLRVYEKGKAMNAEARKSDRPETADPRWLRIEFQIQNILSEKKAAFAAMTPGELLRASSAWVRDWLALAADEIDLTAGYERARIHRGVYENRRKTLADAAQAGAKQYGKTFCKVAAENIIQEDFNGSRAAAEISCTRLGRRAALEFYRQLMATDKVDKVLDEYRLRAPETEKERAVAAAENVQARHADAVSARADARERLASQLTGVTADRDGIKRLRERASEAAERHSELAAAMDEARATPLPMERTDDPEEIRAMLEMMETTTSITQIKAWMRVLVANGCEHFPGEGEALQRRRAAIWDTYRKKRGFRRG